MSDIYNKANDKIQNMMADRSLLCGLVLGSENMSHSTAVKGPAIYVLVKPGNVSREGDVSNIDFVKKIYEQYGINLKKHVTHVDGVGQDVLCISLDEFLKLDKFVRDFFHTTAPDKSPYNHEVNQRHVQIYNMVFNETRNH